MNALDKAFTATQRSYFNAKATVGAQVGSLMGGGPTGLPFGDSAEKYASARSQLEAFTSWVFAAVRPICNRIAAQAIRVGRPKKMRRTKVDAGVTPLDSHPILTMFDDPNDLMTGHGLRWALVASINLTGRAFLFVPENVDPPQCYMVPSSWVVGHTGKTSFESWKVQPPGHGQPIAIPAERMVYFSFPNPGDPWGCVSPLQAVASAINNDSDILRSQRAAFARGIFPTHVIYTRKDETGQRLRLSQPQERQILSALRRRYEGTAKHGEPFIVGGDWCDEIKALSLSPSEMNWLDSSRDVKQRILEAFGVSPYILGARQPGRECDGGAPLRLRHDQPLDPVDERQPDGMASADVRFGGRTACGVDRRGHGQ